MELAIKFKSKLSGLPGLISILSGILALVYFNIEYATRMSTPFSPFIFMVFIGVTSGVIGLFTKQNRLYALWGLGIGIFLSIHTILMLFFSLTIHYTP